MAKTLKHDGYEFQLDDSRGCYVEVSFKGKAVGVVGLNLAQAEEGKPFSWFPTTAPAGPEGLQFGNGVYPDVRTALTELCDHTIRQYRQRMESERIDRKAACERLHKEVNEIGG